MPIIEIASKKIYDWRGGTNVKLVAKPTEAFTSSDGYVVETAQTHEVTCTVANETDPAGDTVPTLTIPAFSIYSTTDALNNTNARWSFYFATSTNKKIKDFEQLIDVAISPNLGNPMTYVAIIQYNIQNGLAARRSIGSSGYTKDEVLSLLANQQLQLGYSTRSGLSSLGRNLSQVTDDVRGIFYRALTSNKWIQLFGEKVNCDEYNTISEAVSNVGSSTRTLLISTSQSITTNLTIPANITLEFTSNGVISIPASTTITIRGRVLADKRSHIFDITGSGEVLFGGYPNNKYTYEISPFWFGAKGDATTDSTIPFQKALNSISNTNTSSFKLVVPAGVYKISNTLVYEGGTSIGILLEGEVAWSYGPSGSRFDWHGQTGGTMLYFLGANALHLKNLEFDACNPDTGLSNCLYGLHIDCTNTYSSSSTKNIGSITRSSNTVTITSTAHGFTANGINHVTIKVADTGDSTLDGTYYAAITDVNTLTFLQTGSNVSILSTGTVTKYKSSTGNKIIIDNVIIGNPKAAGSACIALGHTDNQTIQVADFTIRESLLSGNDNSAIGVYALNQGNLKNYRFINTGFSGLNYGTKDCSSGRVYFESCEFSPIGTACIYGGGGVLIVNSCEFECTDALMVSWASGSNPSPVTLIGNSWESTVGEDGVFLVAGGALTCIGNNFRNIGNSTPGKIQLGNPLYSNTSGASIVSIGNWYEHCTVANSDGFIPAYDGSANPILKSGFFYDGKSVAVYSSGDSGGELGALVNLKPVTSFEYINFKHTGTEKVARSGNIRLYKTDSIKVRNSADDADYDVVTFDSAGLPIFGDSDSVDVDSGQFIGNGSTLTKLNATELSSGTVPDARFPATLPVASGLNLTNLNASNLASGTVPLARLSGITNTEISASAGIAYSKLSLTGAILNTDLAGSIAFSKLVALTAHKALASDVSGIIGVSNTTDTELGYVSGVTGAIQTQLDSKASLGASNTFADGVNFAFNTVTGSKVGTGTTQKIGFWNAAPNTQQTVTGTRADPEQALKSLLSKLALIGLIVDSST